jgi:hypothetical protein
MNQDILKQGWRDSHCIAMFGVEAKLTFELMIAAEFKLREFQF